MLQFLCFVLGISGCTLYLMIAEAWKFKLYNHSLIHFSPSIIYTYLYILLFCFFCLSKKIWLLYQLHAKIIMSQSVVFLFIYLFIFLRGQKNVNQYLHIHYASIYSISNQYKGFNFLFKNCFQCLSFQIKHNSNSIEQILSNPKLCCCSDKLGRNRSNIHIYEC